MYEPPEGPPEPCTFDCGWCRLPVVTYWAPGHRGLLLGDYDLLGDVIFHKPCCDEMLEKYPP